MSLFYLFFFIIFYPINGRVQRKSLDMRKLYTGEYRTRVLIAVNATSGLMSPTKSINERNKKIYKRSNNTQWWQKKKIISHVCDVLKKFRNMIFNFFCYNNTQISGRSTWPKTKFVSKKFRNGVLEIIDWGFLYIFTSVFLIRIHSKSMIPDLI